MKPKLRLVDKRIMLVAELGGVYSCQGADCWHTGSCEISDIRCLHLDHINGDGSADRKRLNGQVVAYYTEHLSEAREVLQVLCANCNWVKRIRDRENRGRTVHNSVIAEAVSAERMLLKRTECDIENSPHYLELVDKYHGLVSLIINNTGYTDLLNRLDSYGLDSSPQCTVAHYLAKYWLSSHPSGGTKEELTELVRWRVIDIDVTAERCRTRMRERDETGAFSPAKRGDISWA